MICNKCGNQIDDNTKFCPYCGESTEQPQPQQTQQPQPQYQQPPHQQYQANPQYMMPKKKKGKGCLIALLVVVVIIGFIVAAAAIFLPGLFKPKDLGIKTSKSAYDSAMAKLRYTKDEAPETGEAEDYTYEYGATNSVDTALTSEELTSFFNYNRPDYYAIENLQIRINDDDTIEVSGSLNRDYLLQNILEGEYTEEEIKKEIPMLNLIPSSINFYVNLEGSITNNEVDNFNFNDIEIMGIGIPDSVYDTDEAYETIIDIIDTSIEKVMQKTGASYESVKVENGELNFEGEMPSFLERTSK